MVLQKQLDVTISRTYFHFNEVRREPVATSIKRNESKSPTIVIVEVDVEAAIVPPSSWGVTAMSITSTCSMI